MDTNSPQPRWDMERIRSTAPAHAQTLCAFGIGGLDTLLDGGLEPGTTWLIEGDPGAGKTLLATHFLQRAIASGQNALCVAVGETPGRLARYYARDWPDLEQATAVRSARVPSTTQPTLAILDPSPYFTELRQRGRKQAETGWNMLWNFAQEVVKQGRAQSAARIVIDPITPLLLGHERPRELWDMTQMLITALRQQGGTATLLTHAALPDPQSHNVGAILEHLCAGVLRVARIENSDRLRIEIYKQRYHAHARTALTCLIDRHGRLVGDSQQTYRQAS